MFPDDAACAAYLEQLRWADGFVCPACGANQPPWRQTRERLQIKNNGFEVEPILSVAQTSVPIKVNLASDSVENLDKLFEIIQVSTKRSVHSFEIKSKLPRRN